MYKVLVLRTLHPKAIELFELRNDVEYEIVEDTSSKTLKRLIANVHAITVRDTIITTELIQAAPALKVVSRHGVGFDNVCMEECNRRGIPIALVGPLNAVAVAEHTFFLILSAARVGIEQDNAIREGDFGIRDRITAFELSGKTLLIVGYGRIGSRVAHRAKAFNMKVVVYDPYLGANNNDEISMVSTLEEGLKLADIVTLHLPLSPETYKLIGTRELSLMPRGSILINASRGGIVDEMALFDAVNGGQLHGAGLDVFATEPLPQDSPLLLSKRIVLSPHAASFTRETLQAMSIKTAENALAGIDGTLDPMLVANPEVIRRKN